MVQLQSVETQLTHSALELQTLVVQRDQELQCHGDTMARQAAEWMELETKFVERVAELKMEAENLSIDLQQANSLNLDLNNQCQTLEDNKSRIAALLQNAQVDLDQVQLQLQYKLHFLLV